MISTTLALSITPPNASQTLHSQPIEPLPLAPRALIFTSPPTSPHLYLNNIEESPPRSSNPPPFPSLDQINNQTFPYSDPMEYEPFFPPTNLSRRGCPVPFCKGGQILMTKIRGMVAATEPTIIQKAVEKAGTLTDEAIRNRSLKRNPDRRISTIVMYIGMIPSESRSSCR
ncbi:hypothetical protein Tco_1060168 [Tanacetum coccineum]